MNKGKLIQFLFLAMCCCALTTMGLLLFYSIDDIELLRIDQYINKLNLKDLYQVSLTLTNQLKAFQNNNDDIKQSIGELKQLIK